MELSGEYTFSAPRQRVWELLLDPAVLKAALPGCERLDEIGPDEYSATMKIGVAMIKGTFQGSVKITEKQEPDHYKMAVEGSGPQGQVSGIGTLELVDQGEKTLVKYKGDANVRGTLARVGARVVQPAAKMIVGQFFERLEAEAKKPVASQ